jgi:4'-phosphopantetheinyl transferase
LIALAVAVHRAVGVDVESVQARETSPETLERFFAPAEATALAMVGRNQRQDRFLEYWTLKESYIKARGMGLSLPLDKFSFAFPNDRSIRLSIQPELADDPARWQFWQFRPTPDFLLALCAERLDSGSTDVVVRKTVPMTSEATIVVERLRTSGP